MDVIARHKRKKPVANGRRNRSHGKQLSRADFVKERVRDAIIEGRYLPGQRIPESEVADWLKVSRTPAREALRRLESEGLVAFGPWRGAVVVQLDRQQVIELYAMREVLEGMAARLAARHISDGEIEFLKELVQQERAAGNDAKRLAGINKTLHQSIYSAAHNRYLLQMLNGLRNSLTLLPGTTFSAEGRPKTGLDEHCAIVEAIARHDPDEAEAAARAHIRAAERIRLRMLFDAG